MLCSFYHFTHNHFYCCRIMPFMHFASSSLKQLCTQDLTDYEHYTTLLLTTNAPSVGTEVHNEMTFSIDLWISNCVHTSRLLDFLPTVLFIIRCGGKDNNANEYWICIHLWRNRRNKCSKMSFPCQGLRLALIKKCAIPSGLYWNYLFVMISHKLQKWNTP